MISVRKMGTRAGLPHYGVECRACRANYGMPSVLRVADLSKEAADRLAIEHAAKYGCGR
jgi:hypothetical protein